jgi:hypothetical protein
MLLKQTLGRYSVKQVESNSLQDKANPEGEPTKYTDSKKLNNLLDFIKKFMRRLLF